MRIIHRESEKSFLFGRQGSPVNTDIAAGDHIKFNHIPGSRGNIISLDTTSSYTKVLGAPSIGRITLKKGYVYDLGASVQIIEAASGVSIFFAWYNAKTGAQMGSGGAMVSSNSFQPYVAASAAPTVVDLTHSEEDALVELRITSTSGSITAIGTTTNFPWCRVIQR